MLALSALWMTVLTTTLRTTQTSRRPFLSLGFTHVQVVHSSAQKQDE